MSSELVSIIDRLRNYFSFKSGGLEAIPLKEKGLLKKAREIQNRIETFTHDEELAKKNHNLAIDSLGRSEKKSLDNNRDALIASMFYLNRRTIGDNLNKELELEQIMAVLESLKGNKHIQLGTGQGKSSVVIPISSIVHSLTSPEKDALVVSINQNLVNELSEKVDSLVRSANTLGFKTPVFTDTKAQKQEFSHEQLQKSMLAESLVKGESEDYSDNLKENLFSNYWGENISLANWEARNKDISKKPKESRSRIYFMTKDQFVFAVSEDEEAFAKTCPHVFFDEIDAPYIIGETYQTTSEDLYMTPRMMVDFTSRYIFDYIISKQLNPDEDFEVFSGKTATLSSDGLRKINGLDLTGFISRTTQVANLESAFKEGMKIVARFLNLEEDKSSILEETVRNYMKINYTENIEDYAESVGDSLAQARYWLNKVYLTEGENIIVRSEYFDQLLENHKFDPFLHLAILALTEKFNFVNLTPKANKSAKFPTILTMMGSKIHGFSGTLSQRRLLTGALEDSPLGNFLREVTGKEIFEIPPREIKKPPPPAIVENKQAMRKNLIEVIKNHNPSQPLLLISHYDIKTVNEILDELKISYPNLTIESLPSLPSKPEKLAEYYDRVKKNCTELAEGRINILISSGSLGIGANIVKSDGKFPDLKVGILGLPENESQLRQNLGRRRAKGNNFFWIVDKDSLRERSAWLDLQQGKLIKAQLTPDKALSEINKLPYTSEEQNLSFVIKLIHDASTAKASNDELTVRYDNFFRKEIVPWAKSIMQKRILEKYFVDSINWQDTKNEKTDRALKRLSRLLDAYGLPDSLYDDCLSIISTFGITAQRPANFIDNLRTSLSKRGILDEIINNWFETVDETASRIESQFYGDDKFSILEIKLSLPPPKSIFIPYNKRVTFNYPDRKDEVELGIVKEDEIILGPAIKSTDGKILTINGRFKKEDYQKFAELTVFQAGRDPVIFAKLNRE